ncbi:ribosomal protein S18 acetylase RimI-like enzyme [Caulobacter ginsengisoli]|uniref:Ribosomal protein S18 acetylase RimI-like enzyme n=1 Tax=Caulobacter ginsengisoli TaxID=400775 RepID=A0ABU0ITG7_9CAUL|nr:GNAT family N-acetyltransferase [Caulobacter ginsengisoli]MDQ0465297.1 ribosomal protein S18 acetylase RimI-like enzyme [Caulobacter ginsengisoli]
MDELMLSHEAEVDEATARRISDGLDDHNLAMTGVHDWQPVGLVLRTGQGELAGGLMGHVWGGWLDIKTLWIAEPFQGRGHGSRLIGEAEAFAVRHGAVWATLDTHNPRARLLYERLGYRVVGELPDFPPGFSKVLMKKALA